MKIAILDTGPIITLSMNSFLYIFKEMKKATNIKFIIPQKVKYEIIDRPMSVPRFELEAIRVKNLIEKKIIEMPNSIKISDEQIQQKTNELMNIANSLISDNGKLIKIVSEAEISCLAISQILTNKNIENLIIIDERTTRLLSERPENLSDLMSHKLHHRVNLTQNNFEAFKNFRFIRSTELIFVAYKLGLLKIKDPKVLEAALLATKFKGSSVSFDELKILKKL